MNVYGKKYKNTVQKEWHFAKSAGVCRPYLQGLNWCRITAHVFPVPFTGRISSKEYIFFRPFFIED
jgi:hypothetical protein